MTYSVDAVFFFFLLWALYWDLVKLPLFCEFLSSSSSDLNVGSGALPTIRYLPTLCKGLA